MLYRRPLTKGQEMPEAYFHNTQRQGQCPCGALFIGPPTQERCAECAHKRKLHTMKLWRKRQKAIKQRRAA